MELLERLRREPATAAVLSRLARRPQIDAHNVAVAGIAAEIVRALGRAEEQVELVARAGLLHDVGKQLVPREIIEKPARLTPPEWAVVRRHSEHGHRILIAAGLHREAKIVLHHHERWDGMGYPHRLVAEGIPLESRILAVADSLDAMCSDRPYRSGLSRAEAMAELERVAGAQLDPACVVACVGALDLRAAA